MKSAFTIALICYVSVGFGQSKKEINAQLRKEYSSKFATCDSTLKIFDSQSILLIQLRDSVKTSIRELAGERARLQDKVFWINRDIETLNSFGIKVNETMISSSTIPDYKPFRLDRDQVEGRFRFEYPLDSFSTNGPKIKAQNEELRSTLERLTTIQAYNQDVVNDITEMNKQIAYRLFQLDSIRQLYQVLDIKFDPTYQFLRNQITIAHDNYKNEGPKGFTEAYALVFPDVFPKPKKKVETEDSETTSVNHMDKSVQYDPPLPPDSKIEIYEVVEQPAEFSGGRAELIKYLQTNLKLPDLGGENEISGKIYMKFVVGADGKISDVKVVKGITSCTGCEAEVIRALSGMPNWIPAKVDGKNVKSYFHLPVSINLNR